MVIVQIGFWLFLIVLGCLGIPEMLRFMRVDAGSGNGVFAGKDILPFTEIVNVSSHLVLRSDDKCGQAAKIKCKSVVNCVPNALALMSCLLQEKNKGKESSYWEFIESIPKIYPTHLVNFDNVTRLFPYFERFSISEQFNNERKSMKMYADLLQELHGASLEDAIWSWRTVSSRSFGTNKNLAHLDVSDMVLSPIVDQFNHASNGMTLSESVSQNNYVVTTGDTMIKAHEQLYLCYFQQDKVPSLAVLANYGFVPSGPAALRMKVERATRSQVSIDRLTKYVADSSNSNNYIPKFESLLDKLGCNIDERYVLNDQRVPVDYFVCEYVLSLGPVQIVELINVDHFELVVPKQRLILRSFIKSLNAILHENSVSSSALHMKIISEWSHALQHKQFWNLWSNCPTLQDPKCFRNFLKKVMNSTEYLFSISNPSEYAKIVQDRTDASVYIELSWLDKSVESVNISPSDLNSYINQLDVINGTPFILRCDWFLNVILSQLEIMHERVCENSLVANCSYLFPGDLPEFDVSLLVNSLNVLKIHEAQIRVLKYQMNEAEKRLEENAILENLPEIKTVITDQLKLIKKLEETVLYIK